MDDTIHICEPGQKDETEHNWGSEEEAGMSPKKTSRFSGVTKRYDKWGAQIMQHLGAFAFEADAAIAVNYHVAYLGLDRPLNQVPLEEYAHD